MLSVIVKSIVQLSTRDPKFKAIQTQITQQQQNKIPLLNQSKTHKRDITQNKERAKMEVVFHTKHLPNMTRH